MASYTLMPYPVQTPIDAAAAVLPGGIFKFYLAGTTTPTPVYDKNGASLGTTVTADANGQFVPIFLDPAITYKIDLTDSDGVSQTNYPVDNVTAVPLGGSAAGGLDIIQIEALLAG